VPKLAHKNSGTTGITFDLWAALKQIATKKKKHTKAEHPRKPIAYHKNVKCTADGAAKHA